MSEIKNNLSDLFDSFTWTREWFVRAESVADNFALIEFIRQKIRETDVRSFNKFLQSQSAPPIKNHYQLLINHSSPGKHISNNDNDAIIDHIIHYAQFKNTDPAWSGNKNPKMIEYLLKNPDKINWEYFSANPSESAVDYALNNIDKIDFDFFSANTNTKAVQYMIDNPANIRDSFSANNNDLAVTYLLSNKNKINILFFNTNTNDRAVSYLLQNPHYIDWFDFNENSSDVAVDYLLSNPSKINKDPINTNENVKVTKYLIDNPEMIYSHCFIRRTDDMAVQYTLSGKLDPYYDYLNLSSNSNDIMMEYLMNNPKMICITRIEHNNCNYNLQKFREFNKLGFPGLVV
jgi:hypothetical protein